MATQEVSFNDWVNVIPIEMIGDYEKMAAGWLAPVSQCGFHSCPSPSENKHFCNLWRVKDPDSLCTGPVYIQEPKLIITVPADDLAPNGAKPSAGTVVTTDLDTISLSLFGYWSVWIRFSWSDDILQNGRWDLT